MNGTDVPLRSADEQASDLCRRRHIMAGPGPGVACSDCKGLVGWLNDMMTPRIITGPLVEPPPVYVNPALEETGIRGSGDLPEGQGLIAFLVGTMLGMIVGAVGITLARLWFWS